MHKVRSCGNISRRKTSGNNEDTFFELCCAGPNIFKAVKNAAHTGSFSQPEFLKKDAEPQTVKQCALHPVAASVRVWCPSTVLARLLPLEDPVCFDGVSGILSAGRCRCSAPPAVSPRADSGTAETDRLHEVLETKAASSLVAEPDQLQRAGEQWCRRLSAAWWSLCLARQSWWPAIGAASAGQVGNLCCGFCRHLTMLTMSIHEVLVARMVSMTCMMHARIVWVHMLHA